MAIFGIFGKKEEAPASAGSHGTRAEDVKIRPNVAPGARLSQKNAERASATARKIDAIESEMSSEFTNTDAANSTLPIPPSFSQPQAASTASRLRANENSLAEPFKTTTPSTAVTTGLFLENEDTVGKIEVTNSESAQLYEEAAILFANGQSEMAEQVLRAAIEEDTSRKPAKHPWWMLFDLYQITGNQQQFESVAIEYARKFETSPPAWSGTSLSEQRPAASRPAARPTVSFVGKLDNSIIKTLERALKQAENSRVLRLEFSKVSEVDPVGCGLVLRLLKRLQKTEHELILVGTEHLVAKVRSILQVGRRDETEAPWLMLLEILRLLNKEREFEEASMDYCITFEVSPPPFVAPGNKVRAAAATEEAAPGEEAAADRLPMPPVIEGKAEQLMAAISQFAAAQKNEIILDCTRLNRVDFTAAGQLLIDLAPLAAEGRTIHFQQVNHLVTALFSVMGVKDIAVISPRKY